MAIPDELTVPREIVIPSDVELFEQAKHFGDALMAQRLMGQLQKADNQDSPPSH